MSADTREEQLEEIEALKSVYDESHVIVDGHDPICGRISVEVKPSTKPLKLFITTKHGQRFSEIMTLPPVNICYCLPSEYPRVKPDLDIECEWMNEDLISSVKCRLEKICEENIGMGVLYFCCEEVVTFVEEAVSALTEICLDSTPYANKHNLSNLELLRRVSDSSELSESLHFESGCYDCEICFENKMGRYCVQFRPCMHVFCKECVSSFFSERLRNSEVRALTCPAANCPSTASQKMVRSIIGEEEYERYERILLDRALDQMTDVVPCPRKTCQQPVLVSERTLNLGTCQKCGLSFCVICFHAYHGVDGCDFKTDLGQASRSFCNSIRGQLMNFFFFRFLSLLNFSLHTEHSAKTAELTDRLDSSVSRVAELGAELKKAQAALAHESEGRAGAERKRDLMHEQLLQNASLLASPHFSRNGSLRESGRQPFSQTGLDGKPDAHDLDEIALILRQQQMINNLRMRAEQSQRENERLRGLVEASSLIDSLEKRTSLRNFESHKLQELETAYSRLQLELESLVAEKADAGLENMNVKMLFDRLIEDNDRRREESAELRAILATRFERQSLHAGGSPRPDFGHCSAGHSEDGSCDLDEELRLERQCRQLKALAENLRVSEQIRFEEHMLEIFDRFYESYNPKEHFKTLPDMERKFGEGHSEAVVQQKKNRTAICAQASATKIGSGKETRFWRAKCCCFSHSGFPQMDDVGFVLIPAICSSIRTISRPRLQG